MTKPSANTQLDAPDCRSGVLLFTRWFPELPPLLASEKKRLQIFLLPLLLTAGAVFCFTLKHQIEAAARLPHYSFRFPGSEISGADANAVLTVPAGYHLTFSDDFQNLSISDRDGAGTRWYSHTVQCCMADTSAPSTRTHMAGIGEPDNRRPFWLVPGGGLDIRLQKAGGEWYSGVLASVDRNGNGFAQQYGYFEMRAKFPKDRGTWPAFWLLNSAALKSHAPAGEIDIVESYMFAPDYVNTTLHDWTPPAKVLVHKLFRAADLSDGFHTFAMLWTVSEMSFACDGHVLFRMPTPDVMHQPYYPIIDLGLGGGWPTSETPPRSDLIIQYVRVWAQ